MSVDAYAEDEYVVLEFGPAAVWVEKDAAPEYARSMQQYAPMAAMQLDDETAAEVKEAVNEFERVAGEAQ